MQTPSKPAEEFLNAAPRNAKRSLLNSFTATRSAPATSIFPNAQRVGMEQLYIIHATNATFPNTASTAVVTARDINEESASTSNVGLEREKLLICLNCKGHGTLIHHCEDDKRMVGPPEAAETEECRASLQCDCGHNGGQQSKLDTCFAHNCGPYCFWFFLRHHLPD